MKFVTLVKQCQFSCKLMPNLEFYGILNFLKNVCDNSNFRLSSIVLKLYSKLIYRLRTFGISGSTLPWATSCLGPACFVFKCEENKYFPPYAYCFLYKSDLLNPNFVGKKYIWVVLPRYSFFTLQNNLINS